MFIRVCAKYSKGCPTHYFDINYISWGIWYTFCILYFIEINYFEQLVTYWISNQCILYLFRQGSGYWLFEFCNKKHILQFHQVIMYHNLLSVNFLFLFKFISVNFSILFKFISVNFSIFI